MPPALFQPPPMNNMGMGPPKNMGMPPNMMNPMGGNQFGMKPPPFPGNSHFFSLIYHTFVGNLPMNLPPLPNLPGNM